MNTCLHFNHHGQVGNAKECSRVSYTMPLVREGRGLQRCMSTSDRCWGRSSSSVTSTETHRQCLPSFHTREKMLLLLTMNPYLSLPSTLIMEPMSVEDLMLNSIPPVPLWKAALPLSDLDTLVAPNVSFYSGTYPLDPLIRSSVIMGREVQRRGRRSPSKWIAGSAAVLLPCRV